MTEISPEQLQQWKKQHGDVYVVDVDGRKAWLKRPDRKTLSYAGSVATKDPIKFNEILLANCWLGGDEAIKTDDTLFLSVSQVLGTLVEVREATLVKL
ncbi:MAG: hypothetical protein EAY75_15005 [Bacteroidetes bacterium]|nr:MAG: hypothetical protein EAY75_15005 [Bacteroidota bacterium]